MYVIVAVPNKAKQALPSFLTFIPSCCSIVLLPAKLAKFSVTKCDRDLLFKIKINQKQTEDSFVKLVHILEDKLQASLGKYREVIIGIKFLCQLDYDLIYS